MTNTPLRIVLASTSPFRRELLGRLRLPFEIATPDTDESPLSEEAPEATAVRLAIDKARNVAHGFPHALIIGSDQVAHANGRNYGKPGTRDRAIAQLAEMSGNCIVFHTALALHNSRTGQTQSACIPTTVGFRTLTAAEIERYVDADQPLNCAGSAKSESLGVSLLEYMRGDDPTALIGLPLIALCRMLRDEGIALP